MTDEEWIEISLKNTYLRRKKIMPIKIRPERHKEYVVVVLDKSGSMDAVRGVTITGFNEQLDIFQRPTDKDISVAIYTFNDDVAKLHGFKPAAEVERLSEANYVPNGMTAMLDAVAQAIDETKEFLKDDDKSTVLFLIMSDGQENYSRTHTWASVAERIQERQGTNRYTFTYMGANQDLSKIQKDLHIPKGNMSSYVSDVAGTKGALKGMCVASAAYMSRSLSDTSVDCFYADATEKKDEGEA